MAKPAFDPSQPFEPAKPAFDPTQPFQAAGAADVASTPEEAPGALKSGLLGLEQGATMDFAPRVNASLIALYNKLKSGGNSDLGKDYDQSLSEQQALMKSAKQAHPYMYGAGNLAGAVGATALTGGENLAGEGLAGAAKLGAGYGALTGLGNTKDLTNLPQAGEDALIGGGVGALGGAVTGAASDVLSPFLGQAKSLAGKAGSTIEELGPIPTAKQAFKEGMGGNMLVGDAAHKRVLDQARGALDNAYATFQDSLNQATSDASGLRDAGPVIDISQWAHQVGEAADDAKSFHYDPATHDAIDAITNKISNAIEKWGTDLTPIQANALKKDIGALGSMGDSGLKNDYARSFVNRIMSPITREPNEIEKSFQLGDDFSPLKSVINDSIEGLDPAQQRIHKLLSSQDDFPDLPTLLNSKKANITGNEATHKLQDFYSGLPVDVRQAIEPTLDNAAASAYTAERIGQGGLNKGIGLAETGKGALWSAANMVGTAVRGVQDAVGAASQEVSSSGTGQLFKKMMNATPQAFTDIGSKLAQVPGAMGYVGKALIGAASKDQVGRNAVIFALAQNPAYRDVVEKHFGNGTGIDDEGPASSISQKVNVNQ